MKKIVFAFMLFSISVFAKEYKSVITTDTHEHKEVEHYTQSFCLESMNASTIGYIYVSPMRDKCFAPIIAPKYATILSFLTKEQYKCNNGMDGFGTNAIENDELKELYMAIYEKDTVKGKEIFLKIFNRINDVNCRIKFFGKDKWNRNTLYIYKVGFADRGVVVYYPDDFSCLIKGKWDLIKMWMKDPTRVGYGEFVRRFIELMLDYNKHIKIEKAYEHNEEIYVLKFKEFKGVK